MQQSILDGKGLLK